MYTRCVLLLCLVFIYSINIYYKPVQCEKILSVSFWSGKSHKIVYEPLLHELAKRGHEVTILSPVATNKKVKNVRDILTIDYMEALKDLPNLFETKEKGGFSLVTFLSTFDKLCTKTYDLPHVRELMNEKFDLIISQPLFNDCVLGFIHHFNTTLILINLVSSQPQFSWVTGTPSPISFIPYHMLPYTDRMTYYERMINFATTIGSGIFQNYYFKPRMAQIYREKLGNPNIPSVNEILNNVSLILSNGHFSLTPPKPFLPDIVEVGGMHCHPAQPLSQELEQFVNSSGIDGFIYFSMGSAIQASTMPEKFRIILVNVFAKLKQKVLWKWETEEMADLPKNIKLGKWLPQQDILGHPKMRMFITHGGYGSTTEAVYHGAPLLGIPMFGDQELNMQKSESSGFALTLDLTKMTEETLLAAINRILNEPSFTERAKSLSKIFRDQPDKPLDRAVFWTEYVMRHKGAIHMRSAARDLNFFQYNSLDVIASYTAILFTVIYIIFAIFRFLLRKLCGSSKQSSNKKTSKKTN